MRNQVRTWATGCALVALSLAGSAMAIPTPANDNWVDATVIGALPFSSNEPNIYYATVEGTDPEPPCLQPLADPATNSVWYKYTTGSNVEYVTLNAPVAGGVVAIVTVYTGAPGTFTVVSGGCAGESDTTLTARIAGLRLAPNTTYTIEVAATFPVNDGNILQFTMVAAQQYHVTKSADTNDGTCDSDCSLREAISASNANPGAVLVPAGLYKLSRAGAKEYANDTGDLDLTSGMGIYGAGMHQTTIDADDIDRVMLLDPLREGYLAFILGDLTLTNGTAPSPGIGDDFFTTYGGGLCAPSGFGRNDYVGLERIAVTNSTATDGGGIELLAPGTIRDSWIAGNSATSFYGAGISASPGERLLAISGSTISNNIVSGANGGGMFANGKVSLVNSTVSNNSSRGPGGGIYYSSFGDGLSIASSTIVFNVALYDNPNPSGIGSGVYFDGTAANSLVNSIVAYNTGGEPTSERDCHLGTDSGNTLTASHNLVQFPDNCPITAGDAHVDPKVLPTLSDHGGPTPTHYLDNDSPARDSGDPINGCRDTAYGNYLPLAWDQRGPGFPRQVGAQCDKGAVEWSDLVFQNGFETPGP